MEAGHQKNNFPHTRQPGNQTPSPREEGQGTPGAQRPESASNIPNFNDRIVAPSINLPKGGGAIQGIGEKFQVSPVTGTGSMTVPIAISPGRAGFAPALALSYDSGSGNSPFGLGWNVGLPAITRKTQKGLPRYRDIVESDTFILSGAEDLVPVLEADGTKYSRQDGNFTVYRYRPRIEGLFARIERWAAPNGIAHWRSISKDNITTIYGESVNSRLVHPADPRKIFQWKIERSFDDKGNVVEYEYQQENGANVEPTIYERNRASGNAYAQTYLKRIRYGNTQMYNGADWSQNRWLFELVFDYGEHVDPTDPGRVLYEAEEDAWPVRPDIFSSFRSGFDIRTYRLCRRILMYHHLDESGAHIQELPARTEPFLVKATELHYQNGDHGQPGEFEAFIFQNPNSEIASMLVGVSHRSYHHEESASLPPVEFVYSLPVLDPMVHHLTEESLENLPVGIDGVGYQFIDLDGEGLNGVLTQYPEAWYYKRNLGNGRFGPKEVVNPKPSLALAGSPNAQLSDLDGNGQLNLVIHGNGMDGYYELDEEGKWDYFLPFRDTPNINWGDPNLRFIDLNGDGHADILITENDNLVWYASKEKEGYADLERVAQFLDEENGPRLVFNDGTQTVFLADMAGDGLTDLVRIRNGEICYWANMGYGRFSPKITMADAPIFDTPEQFDPARIRLADIDGTGTTDVLYLGKDLIQYWHNQSGNSWQQGNEITSFPKTDNLSAVQVMDLLGKGTACLVWSSPLPNEGYSPIRYIDLMAGALLEDGIGAGTRINCKPYLLTETHNNMGAITRLRYEASTRFYLEDRLNGTPWITKLPFPVQVLCRVETYDAISQNTFVNRYAYHHGYFDGVEREFRGFGMVEQWDTEDFALLTSLENHESLGTNWSEETDVPPVYTKTWFHTGFYKKGQDILQHYEGEYFQGDTQAWRLSNTRLPVDLSLESITPEEFSPDEIRELCRAMKGSMLRQEVYGLDEPRLIFQARVVDDILSDNYNVLQAGDLSAVWRRIFRRNLLTITQAQVENNGTNWLITDLVLERSYEVREANGYYEVWDIPRSDYPYTVTENNYGYSILQRRGENKHAVFFVSPAETLSYQYERQPQDPRIAHQFNLEMDPFGNITRSAAIVYPRREAGTPLAEQEVPYMTFAESAFINRYESDIGYYRIGIPWMQKTFEVPIASNNLPGDRAFSRNEILDLVDNSSTVAFDEPVGNGEKRLLNCALISFYNEDLDNELAFGDIAFHALPYKAYQATFTENLFNGVYEGRIPIARLNEAGYIPFSSFAFAGTFDAQGLADSWWSQSGRSEFSSSQFYLPVLHRDPFEYPTAFEFDNHQLFLVGSTISIDGIDLITSAANDYRVLQPEQTIDPNQNISEVLFDIHGMVVLSAISGSNGAGGIDGDILPASIPGIDFTTYYGGESLPEPSSRELLSTATSRLIYQLDAYYRTRNEEDPHPNFVHTITRERHLSNPGGDNPRLQHVLSYSDGFGRAIMTKVQAEPGEARTIENGSVVTLTTDSRWVGNGRTVFNNKGLAVHVYEPYFSTAYRFEDEEELVQYGVTPTFHYDPLGRNIRTDLPDDTFSKVQFSPWGQADHDQNDTVLESAWYAERGSPDPGDNSHDSIANRVAQPERRAAWLAAQHANTPNITHLDTLGRPFLSIAHNRARYTNDGTGTQPVVDGDIYIPTRTELDIIGNPLAIYDGRRSEGQDEISVLSHMGNRVVTYTYAMNGAQIAQDSMDAGERMSIANVFGNPFLFLDIIDITNRDFRVHETRYDDLQRPTHLFISQDNGLDPDLLTERLYYGEQVQNDPLTGESAQDRNLYGQVHLHFDGAGLVINERFDFKGNILRASRRLSRNHYAGLPAGSRNWRQVIPNWMAALDGQTVDTAENEANTQDLLENAPIERFTVSTNYDALNRPYRVENHHDGSVQYPLYNEAGLLDMLKVNLYGRITVPEAEETEPSIRANGDLELIVQNIDYNEKGQRQRIQYPNVTTTFEYDPLTFRLRQLRTTRQMDSGDDMQNYQYFYDPVGNITSILDNASQRIYFQNNFADPHRHYAYDAIYQLIEATGREQAGLKTEGNRRPNHEQLNNFNGFPVTNETLRSYTQRYYYDAAGNMEQMRHYTAVSTERWTRINFYEDDSNRLTQSDPPSDPFYNIFNYEYDDHGNMLTMPHLEAMTWDYKDQLVHVNIRGNGEAFYSYNSERQRVRKVVFYNNHTEERIYLGGFELFRTTEGGGYTELQTLHIMDDTQRVCMIETPTSTSGQPLSPSQYDPRFRFQLSDHLGSAIFELDEAGRLITHEEYHPYGSTAFRARRSGIEISEKRYRYTGMERDEETGLNYHGARYYMVWLGRWIGKDPIGIEGGLNLYGYSLNNPIAFFDNSGKNPLLGAHAASVAIRSTKPSSPTESQLLEMRQSAEELGFEQPLGFKPGEVTMDSLSTVIHDWEYDDELEEQRKEKEEQAKYPNLGDVTINAIVHFPYDLVTFPDYLLTPEGPSERVLQLREQLTPFPYTPENRDLGEDLEFGVSLAPSLFTLPSSAGTLSARLSVRAAVRTATKGVTRSARRATTLPKSEFVSGEILEKLHGIGTVGVTYPNLELQSYKGLLGRVPGLMKPKFNPTIELASELKGNELLRTFIHEKRHAMDMLQYPQFSYLGTASRFPGRGMAAFIMESRAYSAEKGLLGLNPRFAWASMSDMERKYFMAELSFGGISFGFLMFNYSR